MLNDAFCKHQRIPCVHVIGTQWTRPSTLRAARMVGTTLAEAGFGLVTGDSTGVDRWTAESYCAERGVRGLPLENAYFQVGLGSKRFLLRGGMPLPGFAAPEACRVTVESYEVWKHEVLRQSDAAVMIGGGWASLEIARRYIERGRPVFPLPMMKDWMSNSDAVFQEILKTWDSYPVPGLSRSQFLRLAEPWVSGTGALANLLRGTLALTPDIFISYRRADASGAAGRLAHDLSEHFGQKRVFMDITGIAPSHAWDDTIVSAIQGCRAGIVVIGGDWLIEDAGSGKPRLHEPNDMVCREIGLLLEESWPRRMIFPVLVENARLPDATDLPEVIKPLLQHQVTAFDNATWDVMLTKLIREIETAILAAERLPFRNSVSPEAGQVPD